MFVCEKARIADGGSIRENAIHVVYADVWSFKTSISLVEFSLAGRVSEDNTIIQISCYRASEEVRDLTLCRVCAAYQRDKEYR